MAIPTRRGAGTRPGTRRQATSTESTTIRGTIQPGDCLLVAPSRVGPVQWLIERTQRRLLADLWSRDDAPGSALLARYVHAACSCYDQVGEMTHPRARLVDWDAWAAGYPAGTLILVRRPVVDGQPIPLATGREIASEAVYDAGTSYPVSELLHYYLWSWGVQKLARGQRFQDVFTRPERDVCSGAYWTWCRQAGLWPDLDGTPDARPEAWYPARLAWTARLQTVCCLRTVPGGVEAVDPYERVNA